MSQPPDKPLSESSSAAAENPFASPTALSIEPGVKRKTSDRVFPFESGHARAMWAMRLMGVEMLLAVGSIGLSLRWLAVKQSGSAFEVSGMIMLADVETLQLALGGLQLIFFLAAAVTYFFWIHRAHRNLPALGAHGLQFSPGWAVGYYFTPILNLFRPYQVMREIWQASDPKLDGSDGFAWRRGRGSALLEIWWLFQLAKLILGQVSFRYIMAAEAWDELIRAEQISIAVELVELPALLLTILVVRLIDKRQTASSQRIDAAG